MRQTHAQIFDQYGQHHDLGVPFSMIMRGTSLTSQPYVITACYSDQAYHTYKWIVCVSHAHGYGQRVLEVTDDQMLQLYDDQLPQWVWDLVESIDRSM